MEIKWECIRCILNIRFKDLEILDADNAEKLIWATKLVEKYALLLKEYAQKSPPELLTELFRYMKMLSKIEDPYMHEKERENKMALSLYDYLKQRLNTMGRDERLSFAVKAVAVGNSIDPNVYMYSFEPDNLYREIFTSRLAIDDSFILKNVTNKKMVYVLDNCGEAVFDKILAEELREKGAQVIGVVKGGSFQNDITISEAEQIKLMDSFDYVISTGTDAGSIFWDEISEELKKEILHADIIIAKGLANFEYLDVIKERIPAKKLCIFKVKCKVISELIGAPINSYVAKAIA